MPVRTPAGLGRDGRRLFRDLVDEYEFDPAELVLAEKAARTADDVARIEAEVDESPLTVAGSTGQTRAHPLLAELRGMRAVLAALLRQLALPGHAEGAAMLAHAVTGV